MTDILSITPITATTTTITTTTDEYKELQDEEEGYNQHHYQQQQQSVPISSASTGPAVPSPSNSKSSSSRSASGRLKKSLNINNKNSNKKLIVFASSSKYQLLICILLIIPLLTISMSIILFDVKTQEEYKNSWTVWTLGWCFILIVVLYMAILPRQVDVRSNGNVAIKTCLLTFHIDDIARAYRGGGCGGGGGCNNVDSSNNNNNNNNNNWNWYCDSLLRPRVKFATSLDKDGTVIIRRKHDKWDVVITPDDPEGFIFALENMLQQKENNENAHNNPSFVTKQKPDLASTSTSQPV
jgi:hypothetical protein